MGTEDPTERDLITGALHRASFLARIGEVVGREPAARVSLLLVDVDYYAQIARHYGRLETARMLAQLVERAETLGNGASDVGQLDSGRLGVLLPSVSRERASELAVELRNWVKKSLRVGAPAMAATVSVGCASLACTNDASIGALLQTAEQRLGEAGRSGGDRVVSDGYFDVD